MIKTVLFMIITHGDSHEYSKIQTLEDLQAFLYGATVMESSIEGKDERYRWIEQTLYGLNTDHAAEQNAV